VIQKAIPNNPWPALEAGTEDGRRQRSDRSRRRIIKALFDLIGEGHMSPSAASVAERANVGLRTVFRHFEDIDSIYDEMTAELTNALLPKIVAPYEANTWRARLMECAERRAEIYEIVFPMRLCMSIRRFQSQFLSEQYERDTKLFRSALQSILPDQIISDRDLFGAVEVALDFSTWRQLRQDQGRSVESAIKSIQLTLSALIANIDVA
jgi:AcrR family transcriptional regulator